MDTHLIDEAADNHGEDEVCEHAPLLACIAEDSDSRNFMRESVNESLPISPDRKADDQMRSERRVLTIIIVSTIVFSVGLTIGLIEQSVTQAVEVPPHGGVSTSSAVCTDMARDLLGKGGSAVDAAVAAVLCIGVVRPEVASIGGGGFMVLHQHRKKDAWTFDFRETAPSRIPVNYTSEMMRRGNISIGVPGTVAGLYLAHQKYGKLLWSNVVKPVAALARSGFTLDSSTVDSLSGMCPQLLVSGTCDNIPKYLLDENRRPHRAGTRVRRESYATALDLISEGGPSQFYKGAIGQDIMQSTGNLRQGDLLNYTARQRLPVSIAYNGYTVLSTDAPSAGVAVLHALSIVSSYNWTGADGRMRVTQHRIVEALKFCETLFAGLGDPDFDLRVASVSRLALNDSYCKELRALINDVSPLNISTGMPNPAINLGNVNRGASSASNSVVDHVSVMDSDELLVAVETSLGSRWGSGQVTKTYDIVLNNAMADFDSADSAVNSLRSLSKPRSIASPVIFYTTASSCQKRGTVGSSGSQSSISGTVQALISLLSFDNDPLAAASKPRIDFELHPKEAVKYDQSLSAEIVEYLDHLKHHMVNVSSLDSTVSIVQKVDVNVTGASERGNHAVITY